MVEQEQVRPLAPAAVQPITKSDTSNLPAKTLRRRKYVKCCGCIAAVILLQIILIVILIFTVFRVKDPIIRMNGATITNLELINGTRIPKPGTNMSMIVDVSVKNPNVASFKYKNTTTSIYYRGNVVGEARGPPGRARPRRTMRMNVTVDIMADRILSSPELSGDVGSGFLNMSSYSRIGGRVNMLGMFKRHVTVKMNCTISVNVSSQAIQEQKCKQKVDL